MYFSEIGFENYPDYLKSKHWKEFKQRAWKNSKHKACNICGKRYNLVLHHRSYANLGKESLNDVVLLCKDCHKDVHFNKGTKTMLKRTHLYKREMYLKRRTTKWWYRIYTLKPLEFIRTLYDWYRLE
jgi:hypothetical protein